MIKKFDLSAANIYSEQAEEYKAARDAARQEIRSRWREIIVKYTEPAKTRVEGKETYICPFCGHGKGGDGMKNNPDSKDGNGIKCFGCGFSGDIIDFIMQKCGADYNGALEMAAADLGITLPVYRSDAAQRTAGRTYPTPAQAAQAAQSDDNGAADKKDTGDAADAQSDAREATADYTEYYKECAARLNDPAALSYLQARGISPETAAAHNLGYDPAWISPTVIKAQQEKGSDWRPEPTARIIMPVSKNHYVARAISPDTEKAYQKMNETGGGNSSIFNAAAVGKPGPLFVVEGIFDALSIIECGAAAIALNSTSNADLLIKGISAHRNRVAAQFVLCLDNDDAGRRAAEKLQEAFKKLDIKYITANICGAYKDANDALQADPAALKENIAAATEAAIANSLPGYVTYNDTVNEFLDADDSYIELKSFPLFSGTAKIKKHSSVVLAADTGAGKSSLAINFLNDLNENYPCIYVNLEMDKLTVLRRLVSIQSGIELDTVEGYKNDPETAAAVNAHLKAITSRKPLQIVQGEDVEYTLETLEKIIRVSTAGRKETTIVFIDHSLLLDTEKHSTGRYDRFTQVSEGLRKMTLRYNIVLFVLLQQSRDGKKDENEKPKNSSLKESGSWENDATHICFLWYDPTARRKKILLTKNRNGVQGEFDLNYWKKTQTYIERKDRQGDPITRSATPKATRREKQREKLMNAYNIASAESDGKPTIHLMAEAADVTTATIKGWIKEYGGCMVDGIEVDPAGIDTAVEVHGFVKLTPAEDEQEKSGATNGLNVSARF